MINHYPEELCNAVGEKRPIYKYQNVGYHVRNPVKDIENALGIHQTY